MANISKYKDFEVLFTLSKPKSPIGVLFCTEDLPDKWLIEMVEYKKKTGEITYDVMITSKDLKRWESYYQENGYEKV